MSDVFLLPTYGLTRRRSLIVDDCRNCGTCDNICTADELSFYSIEESLPVCKDCYDFFLELESTKKKEVSHG